MVELTTREHHRFVWDVIKSPEELGRVRMAAMGEFLNDYDDGRAAGRYLAEGLPRLSFGDQAFDLALCSHFLFLYSHEWSSEDHLASVMELCRVAAEVRIFPLMDMQGERSRHVAPVMEALESRGMEARLERVPMNFSEAGMK